MSQRTIACVGKMLVCYASQSKKTESSYRHWFLDWGSAFLLVAWWYGDGVCLAKIPDTQAGLRGPEKGSAT